jgi:hypothetical protein
LFLARSTWNEPRELYYCVHDPEIPLAALQALIESGHHARHWEYKMNHDPKWSEAGWIFRLYSVYLGWPMPRGEYVTDTGLKDPGFGSGPVEFSSIELVTVHARPRRGAATKEYEQKISALRSRVQTLSEVACDQDGITFKNS